MCRFRFFLIFYFQKKYKSEHETLQNSLLKLEDEKSALCQEMEKLKEEQRDELQKTMENYEKHIAEVCFLFIIFFPAY